VLWCARFERQAWQVQKLHFNQSIKVCYLYTYFFYVQNTQIPIKEVV
jgi:hypothetical protein